ncbi:MAG: hypothetical protein JXB36_15000 [Gammaproteobacteria bacterium]|nr:hypothetical protein [Gammaproteobacteria bacterium]
MSENRFGDVSGYFKRLVRTASPDGAATIESLEKALADERDRAAALQGTVDNLKFQIETLEKGYARQLEDARLRKEEAERSSAERDAELAALNARHEEATEALAAARAELQRVTAQRDRLRRQIDGDPETDAGDGPDTDLPEGTINRLLAVASRPRSRGRAPSAEGDDAASDEMLPPELLFRDKDADES